MQTTKFRSGSKFRASRPCGLASSFVGEPEQAKPGCIEVTVEGNGYDLRQLIANRRDIFAAYLQMKPEKRENH
jgi:hypothetical protein